MRFRHQFYLYSGDAVETARTVARTDAARTVARTDAARTVARTPAEVAPEAFPAGTGAPWHALQRHVRW